MILLLEGMCTLYLQDSNYFSFVHFEEGSPFGFVPAAIIDVEIGSLPTKFKGSRRWFVSYCTFVELESHLVTTAVEIGQIGQNVAILLTLGTGKTVHRRIEIAPPEGPLYAHEQGCVLVRWPDGKMFRVWTFAATTTTSGQNDDCEAQKIKEERFVRHGSASFRLAREKLPHVNFRLRRESA